MQIVACAPPRIADAVIQPALRTASLDAVVRDALARRQCGLTAFEDTILQEATTPPGAIRDAVAALVLVAVRSALSRLREEGHIFQLFAFVGGKPIQLPPPSHRGGGLRCCEQ